MEQDRRRLLESLKNKGVPSNIIEAFSRVDRSLFLPERLLPYSYEDIALPLEDGSTISQPTTVAFMLELLELAKGQKVLELGSGSGYTLTLISEIIEDGKVYGVEISQDLAVKSKRVLTDKTNIDIINKDASNGAPQYAPYDRILVSFSSPDMRLASIYTEQLNDGGVLVIPVKESIIKIKKENGKINKTTFAGYIFVPFKEVRNT